MPRKHTTEKDPDHRREASPAEEEVPERGAPAVSRPADADVSTDVRTTPGERDDDRSRGV